MVLAKEIGMAERRAILVGFEPNFPAALSMTGITPVVRIAAHAHPQDGTCEYVAANDFVRYRRAYEPGTPISETLRNKAREICFEAFIQCADRYANTNAMINDIGDYELLFDRALIQARETIERLDANVLLFSNVPHRCATVALLGYARAAGITTAICLETPFPNMFWIIEHWRDAGQFSSSRLGNRHQIDTSPPEQMPFYMNRIASQRSKSVRALLKYCEFSLRYLLTPFMLPQGAGQQRVNRILGELRNSVQMLHYNSRLRRATAASMADLPQKFVYFPLHLQPEMVTDILGGRYRNQLLALLRLRELVPDEIPIVVKENPKQNGLMRSPLFWERLSTIPNLVMVEDRTSSIELVRRAFLTATVTGTAGWEALCSGQMALAFGYAFWRELPGAYYIGDSPSWDAIEAYRFDRSKFEHAVAELSRYAHVGVTDPDYIEAVEGFSPEENSKKLAQSIIEHLDFNQTVDR